MLSSMPNGTRLEREIVRPVDDEARGVPVMAEPSGAVTDLPRLLDTTYEARFDDAERQAKMAIWAPIVDFLGRYIDADRPFLDLGCDAGYFINNVSGRERWATDIRDMAQYMGDDVQFVQADGLSLAANLPNGHFGTVFMSNYLEHLASSEAVIEQFRVAYRLLAPGGRVVVLQPNIRLVGGRYWDFIDHHVPLTDRSLVEAGETAGFRTLKVITRFLPFSTKGMLPSSPSLVRAYLAVPFAWRFLGKQTLYVAERPS
jgi:SAM-dependent methyltransferase